jgi:hypothetical protein
MRVTVDIDEQTLEYAMKFTGETKKATAIMKATKEFVMRALNKEFGRMVMEGEFADYPLTNDELEEFDR